MFEITKISFWGEPRTGFLKYVAIEIFDENHVIGIGIRGMKLITRRDKGIFLAMPSRKKMDDTHEDIAYPITPRSREFIEGKVLQAYSQYRQDPEKYESESTVRQT